MARTNELTRGPVRQQLVALAVPLLAGNILQQMYNTIDAVIVGRCVGDAAFGAVGVAGSVMNLFLFLISGGCAGTGVLLAQLHGAGDGRTFRKGFFLSALFGGVLSLCLMTAALALLGPLLTALHTPAASAPLAGTYLRIIFLGFPAAFAFHQGSAVLRAAGNTRTDLMFLLVSMGTNLVLDLVFVAGLEMGVAGAALATVLAQLLAALLCLGYLFRCHPDLMFRRADMQLDVPLLRRTVKFSLVSSLHMCSLYIGKLLVQGTVNSLGSAAVSAYTAATRIEGFANSFGDSGAAAMAVFIGQNTGAGERDRVREGFRTGERLLFLLGAVMSALMILLAVPCLRLVLPPDGGESMASAVGYLRLVACFYVFNFLGSGLVGYFRGIGRVNLPVIGAAGHISIRVILSALLADRMGLPAVALATGTGWVCVVIFWSLLVREQKFR